MEIEFYVGDSVQSPQSFGTLEELLDMPLVRKEIELPGHHRLSVSPGGTLISESNGGKSWFVLGLITGGQPGLPEAVFSEEGN